MFRSNTRNTTAGILGIALAGLALSNSAFAMQPLSQGYMLAAGDAAGKNNVTTGKATKPVTAKKTAEGKCGEGKCGDASFARNDTDHDNLISRAEFLVAAPTGAGLFPKFDADGNGFITEKEAYDYLKVTYAANGKPMPAGLFAKYGK